MADVFISYSKSDRSYALDLAEELRARGISVWIDQTGIGGAKNWAGEIVEAIDACSTVLCLLSPHSIASHNVAKEIHLASEKQKHILPILIEAVTLPPKFEYPLAGLQRVFFRDRPAIFQALDSLRGVGATEALPDVPMTQDDTIRIAVLPFDDLSPQQDNQWFADGMMDELISTLGGIDQIKVPPRSDVLHYRDHKKKSRDIAREVGVRYLIEGGVRKANDRIRINASLTDAVRGEQLWTNKFDGSFDDVFDFQESVSKSIVEALKLKLTPEEKQKFEDRGTQNVEAYELYLRGGHEQDSHTKDGYLRALELYERAAALDPRFARARIRIASVCSVYYREYSRDPKWLARAEKSLAEAEAITGETSRTLSMRGTIEFVKGKEDVALDLLTRSAVLDPKNYSAFNVIGNIHMVHQNPSDAVQAFQHVVDVRATVDSYYNLLSALYDANEWERLIRTSERALPIYDQFLLQNPESYGTAISRATVLYWSGKTQEAERAASALLENNELDGQTLYNLGGLFDMLGKPAIRISLFRKAIEHGYREIEQTRTHSLITKDAECEREFRALVQELERIVEFEKTSIPV